jgi:hypothetical protein
VNGRCQAVGISIAKCGKKHGKRYSFPSQKRLTELINLYHGYDVCERTVRRDIKELKDSRWVDVITFTSSGKSSLSGWNHLRKWQGIFSCVSTGQSWPLINYLRSVHL